MGAYFEMGGHASYIWGAYGLAVLVIAGLLVLSIRRLRAAQRMLALLEQTRSGRFNDGPDT